MAAVAAFEEAVALEPKAASHHVNLAYAREQTGEVALATQHLERAAQLDDACFDAHYMLGLAREREANFPQAATHLRRAVELHPHFEQGHADLCRVLTTAGDVAEARDVVTEALRQFPENAELHHGAGNVCMAEGRIEDGIKSFDRAIELAPAPAVPLVSRAVAWRLLKDLKRSIHDLEQAMELSPEAADVHLNLGRSHHAGKAYYKAEIAYRRALELRGNDAELSNALGTVLQASGRADEAAAAFRRAIALKPDLPGAYANLGLALAELGNLDAAIVEYRKALAIKPMASAHDNLAIALHRKGAIDEAIEHYRHAIALNPDNLDTQSNLAGALAFGEHPRASIDAYRELLVRHPTSLVAFSNLLFNLSIDESTSASEYLEVARRYDLAARRNDIEAFVATERESSAPMRVGFVSGDLYGHPVGYFLEGVLKHLDSARFEIYAYPTVVRKDALTNRIGPLFEAWRPLRGLDDRAAVSLIRDDRIDILIDLAGHTGDNRLPIFAARAAPVQVTWLGYFASTGVAAMDYILADEACVPIGNEWQFTERVRRLPQTRLCFTPPTGGVIPEVEASPAAARGHVTFGTFQRLAKINDDVLSLWSQVLSRLPDARLYVQGPETGRERFVKRIEERLEAAGIALQRVTIRPPLPREAYLRAYGEVDIVLDTFPFTGGTTTCEALWMGVPTLTLAGDSMIARQGVAMLRAAGLPEWVAADRDDYVERAVHHASDIEALVKLRQESRRRLPQTALFDVSRFAAHLTDALVDMTAERSTACS